MAVLISCQKRCYLIIFMSWFHVDCAFELGQKFKSFAVRIIPDCFAGISILENTENYYERFLRPSFMLILSIQHSRWVWCSPQTLNTIYHLLKNFDVSLNSNTQNFIDTFFICNIFLGHYIWKYFFLKKISSAKLIPTASIIQII